MNLQETANMMCSDDYKQRFLAEYYQLVIRLTKLKEMVHKWDNGELNFTPICSRETYDLQLKAMSEYMSILKLRASIENVGIEDLPN